MKDCRKVTDDKPNTKDNEQEDANVLKFDDLVVIFYCSHEHEVDYGLIWVVDSILSFYTTPHRRSFATYKGRNFDVVKMRNYGKSKVVGAGDVKVVTNLGNNLILKNVHHILDLRMDLMLAGDLDYRGYTSNL